MKIITTEQQLNETIHISEVNTDNHIVVAIIHNTPTILGKGYNEQDKELTFFILGTKVSCGQIITVGNGYNFTEEGDDVKQVIIRAIDTGYKVEVFRKQDWKQALQWLIDNVE